MTSTANFTSTFEPELVKEIFQFGDIKSFKEGDVIMDYGKYVRMMPIITKGTVKVSRMEENGKELLLYYFCLLYTSPSPRDRTRSRMPSSA